MKKYVLILLLLINIVFLSSCSLFVNKYVEKEDGVDITILADYMPHMLSDQYPSIHFDMKNVRITPNSTNALVEFVRNDPYAFSDAFADHLAQFRPDQIIETRIAPREEKKGAKFGTDFLPIDNGNESLEKIIIVTLDDGTRYSYMFRTFVSGGKVYYAYGYTDNIKIGLEMPLMVVDVDGVRKLILLPLPYDTKYNVSSNTDLDHLLKQDIFLNDTNADYYVFSYPLYLRKNYLQDEDIINETKKWYETHCNLHEENGVYVIEYLGVELTIDFNQKKVNKDTGNEEIAFKIDYKSRIKK